MQLTSLLLTLFTAVAAQSAASPSIALADQEIATTSITQTIVAEQAIQPLERTVEESVRSYFSDVPQLAEVARCESTFRQFGGDGQPLRGKVNSDDVGVMQINEHYHGENAKRLGYDITTLDGNMAFGRYLYEKYGTSPWSASAKCWKKPATTSVAVKK